MSSDAKYDRATRSISAKNVLTLDLVAFLDQIEAVSVITTGILNSFDKTIYCARTIAALNAPA
jgi:hypothetical protein